MIEEPELNSTRLADVSTYLESRLADLDDTLEQAEPRLAGPLRKMNAADIKDFNSDKILSLISQNLQRSYITWLSLDSCIKSARRHRECKVEFQSVIIECQQKIKLQDKLISCQEKKITRSRQL